MIKESSPDSEEDWDKEYTRPAKKQKEKTKTQATVKDYFSKESTSKLTQRMKPASPPKRKGKGPSDESDYEDVPRAAGARTGGRGTRKYVEILSSSSSE